MQISSRFTVALHILTCAETFGRVQKVTSEFLAASINTNPVIIRRILSQLRKAGLISVARGTGGIRIVRPLPDITFYDVYKAVDAVPCSIFMRIRIRPVRSERTFASFSTKNYGRYRTRWKMRCANFR